MNISSKARCGSAKMGFGLMGSVKVFCTVLLLAGCLLELADRSNGFPLGTKGRRSFFTKSKLSGDANGAYEYQTRYYTQTLDHFSYTPRSYKTFQQRYLVNSKHWGGPQSNSPILVYTGDEGYIEEDVEGFFVDIASRFRALLVYIEHRYYGKTMPFGSRSRSFKNAKSLGYFTSTQALADYATLIVDLKKNLSAEDCPVIVYGGSYGGMLAAWFRLKYPHIAIGALASSAPILYFDDITPQDGYGKIVTQDFKNASESCYRSIKNSWRKIDAVASREGGLHRLSQVFKTCKALRSTSSLKNWLILAYTSAAQYNNPPRFPLKQMCSEIDGLPKGADLLQRIYAGANFAYNDSAQRCFDVENPYQSTWAIETVECWQWQSCTEMVMPISDTPNTTMFPLDLFNMQLNAEMCKSYYGVVPRPHWATTEFGGHNIKRVLKRFGSNIIFSNGLRDPYSSGGVLESISDSIVAIVSDEGAHCVDLQTPSADDPEWLKAQRSKEVQIMKHWIQQYNEDLHEQK